MLQVDLLGINYEVGNDQNVHKYIEVCCLMCSLVGMKSHV